VNVCFSKALGAPVGSALAGSKALITRARRFKQQFGGGFRQAGIIAAGALYALEHHRQDLAQDVEHARLLAERLAGMDGMSVDLDSVQSNIVRFEITVMDAGLFATRCHERGVHILPNGERGLRAVTHRDVSRDDVISALGLMASVLAAQEVEVTEGP
jgi:threonine aldolase